MIWDIISGLFGGIWGYVATAVGAVAVIAVAWFKGRASARNKERAAAAERKAETLGNVMEKQDDARKTSDGDLADRLSRRR